MEQSEQFKGKKYILRVNVNSQIFSYTGIVLNYSNDFLTFLDNKTGNSFTFNKQNIIYLEEINNGN